LDELALPMFLVCRNLFQPALSLISQANPLLSKLSALKKAGQGRDRRTVMLY
jgi:hypothetical protein